MANVSEGQLLTVTPAASEGDPQPTRSWQWYRDGIAIPGATSKDRVLTSADAGAQMSVEQIEVNIKGEARSMSELTSIVLPPVRLINSEFTNIGQTIDSDGIFENIVFALDSEFENIGQTVVSDGIFENIVFTLDSSIINIDQNITASSAVESPLQIATIAAWDMQESSGPLLPAKGDIEIPAFNSPGTKTINGLNYRTTDEASSQYFRKNSSPVNVYSADGLTFRSFFEFNDNATQQFYSDAVSVFLGRENNQWYIRRAGVSGRSQIASHDAGGAWSVVGDVLGLLEGDIVRAEISHNAGTATFRFYNLRSAVETVLTNAVAYSGTPPRFTVGASGDDPVSEFATGAYGPMIVMNREFTAAERAADLTPRLFGDL